MSVAKALVVTAAAAVVVYGIASIAQRVIRARPWRKH